MCSVDAEKVNAKVFLEKQTGCRIGRFTGAYPFLTYLQENPYLSAMPLTLFVPSYPQPEIF